MASLYPARPAWPLDAVAASGANGASLTRTAGVNPKLDELMDPAMKPQPLCVSLMGPTASGKTDLAVALAERLPLEIISVDSALVYRGMDIGTAKPDAVTLARAPHHLIDIIEPTASYSAGRFRRDALALMADITARGRTPFLVGGTMLYFKALKGGMDDLPDADPERRAELDARAARHGWPALHRQLAELDPATAARLQPNDAQRIQRALEVCLLSGQPMSALHSGAAGALPWRLLEIALAPTERTWLHERINRRFRAMLDAGFVDEVRRLREAYALSPDMASMPPPGHWPSASSPGCAVGPARSPSTVERQGWWPVCTH
jgi:tRNA dimethylallyltransferase